jgi:alpha-L-fucosidase 2
LGGNCRIRSYEQLAMSGAKGLSGNAPQTNAFYVVDKVKDPVIAKEAKTGKPTLKQVFEYDLPTEAGKKYSFKF